MVFKINISDKGKSWKVETEGAEIIGKSLGEKVNGNDVSPNLEGYEFEITGGSDISGLPLYVGLEGIGLKRILLKKGWGMKDNREGMRLRKTVRGKTISEKVVQINLKVLKHGSKKLEEIFPEQNQAKAETKSKESVSENGKK